MKQKLKTPISFDELQTFLLPLPNLWLLQIFPLRVAQIILLPNLHSLRAENIIRSHKVKVEVRDRPVKRISCFSSVFYFPILYFLRLLPALFYSIEIEWTS